MLNIIEKLNNQNRLALDLFLILLVAVLVTLPIYIYGIPGGNDMYQHFQFAQTFHDSFKNGVLFPSWASSPNYGIGDVGIRFYPPLTSYLLSGFRLLLGNWYDASLLYFLSIFFASGLGVYLWAREWFSPSASVVGGAIYMLVPYHFNQIYQATFYAEFTAAAVTPFCFLFITRICQKGRMKDVLGLALFYGLLILSHLPTIMMASVVFSLYALFSLKKVNYLHSILKLTVSVLISLLLTGFYWIRMVTELNFVKHAGETFSTEYYSFSSHFLFANLSVAFYKLTSHYSSGELAALITFGILIPNLLLYFMSAKKERNYPVISVLIITLVSFLMAVPLSTPIWEHSSLLQKIQFPYRWAILFSLGSSFFAAAGFDSLLENLKTPKRFLSILAIGLLILCIPYNFFRTMGHYLYYPKDYFNNVWSNNNNRPSFECWWSNWAIVDTSENAKVGIPRPILLPDKVVLNNRSFTISQWLPTERTFTLQAGEPGQAQIATMYYPHWQAEVNGQLVEVSPGETGMISFPVSAAESQVKVYFQEPQRVIISYYISGFVWIMMFGLLIFSFSQSFRNTNKSLNN